MDPLTIQEAFEVLEASPVAHLGVLVEGDPYVTPMSFVVDRNRILFRTLPGRKLDGLRSHPSVCVEVARYDDSTGDWVSVIVRGTAREVEDENVGATTVEMLRVKYNHAMGSPLGGGGIHPLVGLPHVIEVTIEEISGLSSGRGWSVRTRPGRL